MAVAGAFSAALLGDDAGAPARLRAVRVARALHAVSIEAARRPARLAALRVIRAFDARAARQIAHGPPTLAVGGAGARPFAAATREIAGRASALGVARALHAAPVALIADAVRALALCGALHAAPGALLAEGPAGLRAVRVARAVDAASSAVAGGPARLAAVRVEQALHAHVELGTALGQRLSRAVARLRARRGARRQHGVTAPIAAALVGRATLRTHVAHARRSRRPAVGVEHTLDARASRARGPLSRTVVRSLALEHFALARREHVERAPFVQIATQQDQHAERAGRRARRRPHGFPPIRRSASCRAKPSGWRSR